LITDDRMLSGVREAQICWDEESLRRVLRQRFRSAGSRSTGFNTFARREFQDRLDARIIEESGKTPRGMLDTIYNIITQHIRRDSVPNLRQNASAESIRQIASMLSNAY
jgi:hypothetical protein